MFNEQDLKISVKSKSIPVEDYSISQELMIQLNDNMQWETIQDLLKNNTVHFVKYKLNDSCNNTPLSLDSINLTKYYIVYYLTYQCDGDSNQWVLLPSYSGVKIKNDNTLIDNVYTLQSPLGSKFKFVNLTYQHTHTDYINVFDKFNAIIEQLSSSQVNKPVKISDTNYQIYYPPKQAQLIQPTTCQTITNTINLLFNKTYDVYSTNQQDYNWDQNILTINHRLNVDIFDVQIMLINTNNNESQLCIVPLTVVNKNIIQLSIAEQYYPRDNFKLQVSIIYLKQVTQ